MNTDSEIRPEKKLCFKYAVRNYFLTSTHYARRCCYLVGITESFLREKRIEKERKILRERENLRELSWAFSIS